MEWKFQIPAFAEAASRRQAKFQNPNKLQYPIPKLMKKLSHDLILCHLVIGQLNIIWLLPAPYRSGTGVLACLPVGREFDY